MGRSATTVLYLVSAIFAFLNVSVVKSEDNYKYFTWTVTYGTASPLGLPQQVRRELLNYSIVYIYICYVWLRFQSSFPYPLQVILINGQFPGPNLDTVTNDNIILNLINKLDQPFLLTWSISLR